LAPLSQKRRLREQRATLAAVLVAHPSMYYEHLDIFTNSL